MAKEYLNVRGSQVGRPNDIEVNVDTVYIRTNIIAVDESDSENGMGFKGWQYDETQYAKNEYIELIGNENLTLKLAIAELANVVTGGVE